MSADAVTTPRSRRDSRWPQLSTEVETVLDQRDLERAGCVASLDDLSERFEVMRNLIDISDAVPEPIDDDEDSLVWHLEEARTASGG